jgi:predicted nucleic acid-binding protein
MSTAEAPYLVVDSSVSLKWALDDEENTEEALALRDDGIHGQFLMVAPSLWLYEVANGLLTATRRGRLPGEVGGELLYNLTLVGVRFSDPEIEDCYEAALRHGVALYDAVYLALAKALRVPLWTGDRKFLDNVKKSEALDAPFVRWIGDYPG